MQKKGRIKQKYVKQGDVIGRIGMTEHVWPSCMLQILKMVSKLIHLSKNYRRASLFLKIKSNFDEAIIPFKKLLDEIIKFYAAIFYKSQINQTWPRLQAHFNELKEDHFYDYFKKDNERVTNLVFPE